MYHLASFLSKKQPVPEQKNFKWSGRKKQLFALFLFRVSGDLMEKGLYDEKMRQLRTGTTTVGLTCSDGIVMAADKRASMGYFIASREIEKIYPIDDHLSMTIAGSVADAQTLVRIMQAEAKLYKLREGRLMSPKAAGHVLAAIMYQYKFFPFMVQILIGGIDNNNSAQIYSLDPLGGLTEEAYVSTGSGSPIAYGLLEAHYEKGKSVKDNLSLAAKAVSIAMKRDCATGEGVDLVSVTKAGFKRYKPEEIEKLLSH